VEITVEEEKEGETETETPHETYHQARDARESWVRDSFGGHHIHIHIHIHIFNESVVFTRHLDIDRYIQGGIHGKGVDTYLSLDIIKFYK
jgi:hypothetical protein